MDEKETKVDTSTATTVEDAKQIYVPQSIHSETIDRELVPEAESSHLSFWKLMLFSISMAFLLFCIGVDSTIISTAIPKITDHFHTMNDVGWYASAYLLTMASFEVVYGRLYTLFSVKWIFLIALTLFEGGSFLCGIAPTSIALIIGRAIAGLGGAGLLTGALLMVTHCVPKRTVPLYVGAISSAYGVAGTVGPVLGGVFADSAKLTWRWSFYINLPLGAGALIATIFFYKEPKNELKSSLSFMSRLKRVDMLGTVLLLPAVILLLLGITWGGLEHPWKSPHVIGTIILGIILFALFMIVQWRKQEAALIPPRIMMDRTVFGTTFFVFFITGCFFVILYYIPIWFQAIKSESAARSGILNLPLVVGMIVFLGVTGLWITVFGTYAHFYYIAPVFVAIGMGLCTRLSVNSSAKEYMGFQLITGIGFGFGLALAFLVLPACLEGDDVSLGFAIAMFGQTLGGAILTSGAQNIFLHKLTVSVAKVLPGYDVRVFMVSGATKIKDMVPKDALPQVLAGYNLAITSAFKYGTVLACVAILGAPFIKWQSMKGKGITMMV